MHIRNFFKREIDWEDELFAHCLKITNKMRKINLLAGKFKKGFNFEMKVMVLNETFS